MNEVQFNRHRSKSMEKPQSFNTSAINPGNRDVNLFEHKLATTTNAIPREAQNLSGAVEQWKEEVVGANVLPFSPTESIRIYQKIYNDNSVKTINDSISEHKTAQQSLLNQALPKLSTKSALGKQIKWNDHKEITNPINLIKEVYTSGFGIKYLTRGLNNWSKILVASIEDSRHNFQAENTKLAKAKNITLIIVKSFVLSVVVLLTIATATIHSLFGSNNGNDVINKQDYPILHKIITTGVLLLKIGMYVTLGVSSAGFLTFLLNPALIFSYAGSYGPLVVSIFEAIMVSSLTFSQLTLIWVAVSIYACFRVAREFFVSLAKQKSNNLAKDELNKKISTIKEGLINVINQSQLALSQLIFLSDDDKNILGSHFNTIKTQIDQDVMQFLKEVKNLDATANNKASIMKQLDDYKIMPSNNINTLKNSAQQASTQEKLFGQKLQQEYNKFIDDMISVLKSLTHKITLATLMESNKQEELQSQITQKIADLNQHTSGISVEVNNYNDCMQIRTKIESDLPVKDIFASVKDLVDRVEESIKTNNSNVDEQAKKLKSNCAGFIKQCQDKTNVLQEKSKVIFNVDDHIFGEINTFRDELEQNINEINKFKIEKYQDIQGLQQLTSVIITNAALETKLQQLEQSVEQKITNILGNIDQDSTVKVTSIKDEVSQLPQDVQSTLRDDVEEYNNFISAGKAMIMRLPRATTQDLTALVLAIETFKKSCDEKSQNIVNNISKNQTIYNEFTRYCEAVNAHNTIIDEIINKHTSIKQQDKYNILPETPFYPKQHKIEDTADFNQYYEASQHEDNKNLYDLKLKERQDLLLKLCSSWNDECKEQLESKKIAVLSSGIPTQFAPAGDSNTNAIIDSERKRGDSYYQEVVVIEQLHSDASEDFQTKIESDLPVKDIFASVKDLVVQVEESIKTNNSNVDEQAKKLKSNFVGFIKQCQDKTNVLQEKSKVIFNADDNIFGEINKFRDELEPNINEINKFKIEKYQDIQRLQQLTSVIITNALETKLQQLEQSVEQKITNILGNIDQDSTVKVTSIKDEVSQLPQDVQSTLRDDVEEYNNFISAEKAMIMRLPRATTQDLTELVLAIETFKKSCDEKSQNIVNNISKNQTIYNEFTRYCEAVNAHNTIINEIIKNHTSLKQQDEYNILPTTPFHPKQHKIEDTADFNQYYEASQHEDNKKFYDLKLKERQDLLLKLCSSWNDKCKEKLESKKIAVLSSGIPTQFAPAGDSNTNAIIDSERKRGDSYYQEVVVIEQLHSDASEDFQGLVTKLKTPSGTNEIMQSMKSIKEVLEHYKKITNYQAQWHCWVENYNNHQLIERFLSDYKQLLQEYKAVKLSFNGTKAERTRFNNQMKAITDTFDANHRDYTQNMQEKDLNKIKTAQLLFIKQLEQSVKALNDLSVNQKKFESQNSINYNNLRDTGNTFIRKYEKKLTEIQGTKIQAYGIGEVFIENNKNTATEYHHKITEYHNYLQQLKTGTAKQYVQEEQHCMEMVKSIKELYQDLHTKFEKVQKEYEKTKFREELIEQFTIAVKATKLLDLKCLLKREGESIALGSLQVNYKTAIEGITIVKTDKYNKQCTKTLTQYKEQLNKLCAKYKAESKESLLKLVNTIKNSLDINMVAVQRLSPTDNAEYNGKLQELQKNYSEILTTINTINEFTNVDDLNTVYDNVLQLQESLKICNENIIAAQQQILQESKKAIESADKLIKGLFKLEGNQSNGIIDIQQQYDFIENPQELYNLLNKKHQQLKLLENQDFSYNTWQEIKTGVENIRNITDSVTSSFINANSFFGWKSQQKDVNIIKFVEELYKDCSNSMKECLFVQFGNIGIGNNDKQQKVEIAQKRLVYAISMYKTLSATLGGLESNEANSGQQNILMSTIHSILISPIFELKTNLTEMNDIHLEFVKSCISSKSDFTTKVEGYVKDSIEYAKNSQKRFAKFLAMTGLNNQESPVTADRFISELLPKVEPLKFDSFIACAKLTLELQEKVVSLQGAALELDHYSKLLQSANTQLSTLAKEYLNSLPSLQK